MVAPAAVIERRQHVRPHRLVPLHVLGHPVHRKPETGWSSASGSEVELVDVGCVEDRRGPEHELAGRTDGVLAQLARLGLLAFGPSDLSGGQRSTGVGLTAAPSMAPNRASGCAGSSRCSPPRTDPGRAWAPGRSPRCRPPWRQPASILTMVDFPAPFSPTSACTSPAWSGKDTPCTAATAPKDLRDVTNRQQRRHGRLRHQRLSGY